MKGFIQRLPLLIHWIGFLFFLASVIYGFSSVVMGTPQELLQAAITGGLAFFFWGLKWLISGNKSFFPWRS
jgi:hypothetical protein